MNIRWDLLWPALGFAVLVAGLGCLPLVLSDHRFDGNDVCTLLIAMSGAASGVLMQFKPKGNGEQK